MQRRRAHKPTSLLWNFRTKCMRANSKNIFRPFSCHIAICNKIMPVDTQQRCFKNDSESNVSLFYLGQLNPMIWIPLNICGQFLSGDWLNMRNLQIELWDRIVQIFSSITSDDCRRLVESMPCQIVVVIATKGNWTNIKWFSYCSYKIDQVYVQAKFQKNCNFFRLYFG